MAVQDGVGGGWQNIRVILSLGGSSRLPSTDRDVCRYTLEFLDHYSYIEY